MVPANKPSWLGPNFETDQKRNVAVKALVRQAIDQAVADHRSGGPARGQAPLALLAQLTSSLHDPAGPRASAAAELALMLCAYCLTEGRVLKLLLPSDDLQPTNRLAGDRAVSQYLSAVLKGYNIPATDGSMQSSTYRAGYQAAQASDLAVREFLDWVSACGLGDVESLFFALAGAFAELELAFAELPALDVDAFSFVAMKALIERLRAKPSGGAFEQYLVAALLSEEFALIHPSWRVQTKPVGASDASSGMAGDVEVRHRQRLEYAVEVSANSWKDKVAQAGQTGRRTSNAQVTVLAPAAGLHSEQLAEALGTAGVPAGVDVAVVDLGSFLDTTSSRLKPVSRAAAVRLVHRHLVTWGRTRPDLVAHLVESVGVLGLTASGEASGPAEGIAEPVARLRNLSSRGDDELVVEVAREDLDSVLVWVEGRLGR